MAKVALKMSGPTKIIDLDGIPSKKWKLDINAVHLWRGKLWKKEPIGCVLCAEKSDPEYATLCHSDNNGIDHHYCMNHGDLTAVEYVMTKTYQISIGGIVRSGTEEVEDVILFPQEMTLASRNELINRILNEAQQEEIDCGPAPPENI